MTCALLPATAAQGDAVQDAHDTASSSPPATVDRPVPGAVPVTGAATRSLTGTAEPGQTTSYDDQSGIRTYRVDGGYDLDQYLQLAALLTELSALGSSNISDATRASLTQGVTRLGPRA